MYLEKQGGTIRRTTKGWIAMHPQTRLTVSWHSSETSDSRRGEKNLKKDLIGAGFSYPF